MCRTPAASAYCRDRRLQSAARWAIRLCMVLLYCWRKKHVQRHSVWSAAVRCWSWVETVCSKSIFSVVCALDSSGRFFLLQRRMPWRIDRQIECGCLGQRFVALAGTPSLTAGARTGLAVPSLRIKLDIPPVFMGGLQPHSPGDSERIQAVKSFWAIAGAKSNLIRPPQNITILR